MIDMLDPKPSKLDPWKLLAVGSVLIVVAGAWVAFRSGGGDTLAPPPLLARSAEASEELAETTKALGTTQQQAVDQLQIVQDLLAAQRTETKRLADEIEALNAKLVTLQETVSHLPAAEPASSPAAKARH